MLVVASAARTVKTYNGLWILILGVRMKSAIVQKKELYDPDKNSTWLMNCYETHQNTVACQGSGVSIKSRCPNPDKRDTPRPFSPLR